MAGIGDWLETRAGFKKWKNAKLNLQIPNHVTFFYCFGGISFTIIVLQVLTGFFMLFFYVPKAEEAFKSVLYLSNEVPYGWFFRNFHRWGATLLMATVITHMITVFYHKAYRAPRELNWLSGLGMFLIVSLFLITGVILPWNWRGYWLLSIWIDYIESWPVIGPYLMYPMLKFFSVGRSYVTHIWLLPAITALLLTFHFKMVKRHGISGPF